MGRWDGTYDLGDNDRVFNAREWHWIKSISGYMPTTIAEGFAGQDPDLFVSLAVIAMARNRKFPRENWQAVADDMAEHPYTGNSVTLVGDQEEAEDEIPPTSASGNGGSSPTGSRSSSDTTKRNEHSSGRTSETGSAKLAATP
jgi:hypothetical protein